MQLKQSRWHHEPNEDAAREILLTWLLSDTMCGPKAACCLTSDTLVLIAACSKK
jgi:hypothetical protein